MQFDETGPNTHTRRYWVSATVAIGAMVVFAILSILLLLGVVFGVKGQNVCLARRVAGVRFGLFECRLSGCSRCR